jgi:hypothetical protein
MENLGLCATWVYFFILKRLIICEGLNAYLLQADQLNVFYMVSHIKRFSAFLCTYWSKTLKTLPFNGGNEKEPNQPLLVWSLKPHST